MIKIDVEGFELEVMEGLRGHLAQNEVTILYEHSVYRFRERGRPVDAVASFLRGLGYELLLLERGGSTRPATDADLEFDHDCIAMHGN